MRPSLGGRHDGITVKAGGAAFSRIFTPNGGIEIVVDPNGHVVYATWDVEDDAAELSHRRRWRYFVPAEAILQIHDDVTGEEDDA